MIVAQAPVDEASRIEALHSLAILDTSSEAVFDNITQLVAKHLNFPIVAISLVDINRQWFKSSVGLDVCETSRDIAFCAHAVEQDNILAIVNAKKDIRFADNPLVLNSPFIASYYGVPLRPSGNHVVGTLCVIDTVPRKLNHKEQDFLLMMALQIEHLFKLSKSINTTQLLNHQLLQEQIRTQNSMMRNHALMLKSKTGMLLFDQQGTIFDVNQQMLKWLGIDRNKVINTNIKWIYPFPVIDQQEVLAAYRGEGVSITLATPTNNKQPMMLSVTKLELTNSIEFIACFDDLAIL